MFLRKGTQIFQRITAANVRPTQFQPAVFQQCQRLCQQFHPFERHNVAAAYNMENIVIRFRANPVVLCSQIGSMQLVLKARPMLYNIAGTILAAGVNCVQIFQQTCARPAHCW